MKLFLDTNVILDLLLVRQPFFNDIARIITLVEQEKCKLFASSVTIVNCNYILLKLSDRREVIDGLKKLRVICNIVSVDELDIDKALFSKSSDFEDAVQYYSALHNGCNYIITRDAAGFKEAKLPVLTPAEFLISFKKS